MGVGAVIAIQNRPISLGYSGVPSGHPHCGAHCDLSKPCTKTIHAEDNAIRFAKLYVSDLSVATLYTTISPCQLCAGLIWQERIHRVVYQHPYRDLTGIVYLKSHGVEVDQVL